MPFSLSIVSRQSVKADDTPTSDYDVFLSPLSDFKKAIEEAGLNDKVVYLDRGDQFRFRVKDKP